MEEDCVCLRRQRGYNKTREGVATDAPAGSISYDFPEPYLISSAGTVNVGGFSSGVRSSSAIVVEWCSLMRTLRGDDRISSDATQCTVDANKKIQSHGVSTR